MRRARSGWWPAVGRWWIAGVAGIATVILAACGGTPAGDAKRGEELFNQPVTFERGDLQPCVQCHAIQENVPSPSGIGTNFYDLADRAGSTVPGQSTEDYLRTSIVDPDAYLAGGYQDGLMSRDYKKLLTPQQIEDLVAYMMTLKK